MNKGPKLIAVLVVVFIFSIQLLVFESDQSLFPSSDKNENNFFTISVFKGNNDDNDDDDNNGDGKFESQICGKLLDSETCKKIEEEIKSNTKKLTKEEIQAEEIRNKYLEPVEPNQDTINTIEQTNENTQIGNSEQMQNEIIKSDSLSQNQASPPPPPSTATATSPPPPPPSTATANTPPPSASSSKTPSLSLANLNTLDQNQLIDAISSKISQLRNFEKDKITQALSELTKTTATKGGAGDVMKSLKQIGTTILKDPSTPVIDKIIEFARTK